MPRPTVSQLNALGDFTQSFRWTLGIAPGPSGSLPTLFASLPWPSAQSLDQHVETAGLPHAPNTSVEITIHGTTVRQPGIQKKYGTLSFAFAETVDNTIVSWFAAWRAALWNPDPVNSPSSIGYGARQAKSALTADFTLTRLANDDTAIWVYTLLDCYLEDNEPGNLTQNSADPLRPSIMLSYDDFTEAAGGSASGGGPY